MRHRSCRLLVLLALVLPSCIGPADRASLATLEGRDTLPGLTAPVRVERDALGATRYRAASLTDAVRAQGYVNAQERLVQMDILRRFTSGRLAALIGNAGLGSDRRNRTIGFPTAARRAFDSLPASTRELLSAYADGVNAGAAALGAVPPEYRILGLTPEPWEPVDSVHVAYALSAALLTGSGNERRTAVMHDTLPPDLVRFLLPPANRFDAPLISAEGEETAPLPVPPLDQPVPEDPAELRSARAAPRVVFDAPSAALGSNNWAVAGSRTADGRAILAGDMHLVLTMPPIWRHEHLIFETPAGPRFAVGVALPGVPGIIAGSNGHIAWAFTNVTADFADHAALALNPDNPDQYRGPDGWEDFTEHRETIAVRGAKAVHVDIRTTSWGPIVGKDAAGRPLALRRADIDPEPINFTVLDLMNTDTIEDALRVASAWRGPPQNVTVADTSGRIGWTISGFIPDRVDATGETPLDLAAHQTWRRASAPRRPRVVDPAAGIIFTANNRTVPLKAARVLGTGWDLGARAARIKELLTESDAPLAEPDMLRIQLDTRARVYAAFMPFVLDAIDPNDPDRALAYARRHIVAWDGTTDADNTSFRLVRWVTFKLITAIITPRLEPCAAADPRWSAGSPLDYVEPALRLLEEQPLSYLPEDRASWRLLIRHTVRDAMHDIRASHQDTRLDAPWGERNRLRMRHPLSSALSWLRSTLDAPIEPQSGDILAVRVAAPSIGASQRMVVSPGHEEDGIFHMPGGQSGHPLSPFYLAGHEDWLHGTPRPLLPGLTAYRLTLTPPRAAAQQ